MTERVAIVGTAQSWSMTPWTDPGLSIHSLNDAYRLKGFVRADRWYDFHPLDKFYVPPNGSQQVFAHQVPAGHYVRPTGHLDWLASQTIPCYLHPDFATQHPAAATWPHARAFPKAEIEAAFGRYFTSSPGWMIAHALLDGAKELHIYGIHLATEFEYVKQRPNFEYLCGCLLGRGKRTMTVSQGLRRYESADGLLVLPEASPVLQETFQYAFDQRPDTGQEPIKWELHKCQVKHGRLLQALKTKAAWSPWVTIPSPTPENHTATRRITTSTAQAELWQLEALMGDWHDQLGRLQLAQTWGMHG